MEPTDNAMVSPCNYKKYDAMKKGKYKSIKNAKEKASRACSRYIRLRDALEYCRKMRIDTSEFSSVENLPVKCCTCDRVRLFRQAQAGHCFGRRMGGSSGAYFDERNIHAQCGRCNTFEDGRPQIYKKFMLQKYGKDVVGDLEMLHHAGRQYVNGEYRAIEVMYKQLYQKLLMQL